MALHIEQVIDDLKTYLQANLKASLDTVLGEHSNAFPLRVPSPEDYYIGEQNRYRAYKAPAIFLATPATIRPNEGLADQWATMLKQEHRILIDVLVETTSGEEALTRMCWRMAQAIDSCFHLQEFVPNGTTARSYMAYIPKIDYGQMFVSKDQRTFRKDIWLEVIVRHYDLLTPMGGPAAATQVTSSTQIVANASDSLLDGTAATTVITYTPVTTGNYLAHIYYRVITAATDLTLVLEWNDGAAQSTTIALGSQAVGSYTVDPVFFVGASGAPITVTATAGTANQVYVSASLELL